MKKKIMILLVVVLLVSGAAVSLITSHKFRKQTRIQMKPQPATKVIVANVVTDRRMTVKEIEGVDMSSNIEKKIIYKLYKNKKYGFSMEYPADFAQKEPSRENNYETEILPDSEEGIDLVSPDWSVEIIAFGYFKDKEDTLKEEYDLTLNRHPNASFKRKEGNWFVVSWVDEDGYQGSKIFYCKVVMGEKYCNVLKISYPLKQKERYDAIINHMNKSFRTPLAK